MRRCKMARPEEIDVDKVLGQFLMEDLEVAEIARGHGVPVGTIYSILESNGVPVRPPGRTPEEMEELDRLVKEYYESPDPIHVICGRYGTSPSVLYKEIGRRGMSVRRRRTARRGRVVTRDLRRELAEVMTDDS
jgi:transposase-like protein